MEDLFWICGMGISMLCFNTARRIYLKARKRDHGY